MRLSVNQGGSDDANVIFQAADVRGLQQRPQHATDTKPREMSMRSQSQSRLNSKYLWFVSRRGASPNPRTHVNRFWHAIMMNCCEFEYNDD
jgi:hypothetical protein